jgi:hypothetical protein
MNYKDIQVYPDARNWDTLLHSLHKTIQELSGDICLLWIDPAQFDPFSDIAWVNERKVIVPISHLHFDQQFAPYLVELDLSRFADAELFERSVKMAWDAWTLPSLSARNGQTICGWVITDSCASSLALYWARYVHLHRVVTQDKLLRFHDPSVREWLWPTLTAEQKLQLMGPAKTILGVNRLQCLMQQTRDELEVNTTKKLSLSLEQWQQINEYGTVHAAWLSYMLNMTETGLPQALTIDWEKNIFAALQHATEYGINDAQDRQLFATHALQIDSDFHQSPLLQTVWDQTRMGEFYGGVLENILHGEAITTLFNKTNHTEA